MNVRSSFIISILLFSCALCSAQSFSAPGWPVVRGPFSWADNVMNSTTIARGRGGIYDLRRKTLDLYTPAFTVKSFDAASPASLNPEFFSYALGAGLYEDASALLFANSLFAPSDTLDYLRGVLCYDIHDFSRASECFSLIPEQSPYYAQAQSFLDVWNQTPPLPDYKARSHLLAAAMSAVIPGSGKIYAGDLRSGVSTLLIVGALGAMMAESAHKLGWEDWRTITLTSVFGVFYIGNIYGSAVSVSVIKNTYQDARKATLMFDLHIPLHQF